MAQRKVKGQKEPKRFTAFSLINFCDIAVFLLMPRSTENCRKLVSLLCTRNKILMSPIFIVNIYVGIVNCTVFVPKQNSRFM